MEWVGYLSCGVRVIGRFLVRGVLGWLGIGFRDYTNILMPIKALSDYQG